MRRRHSNQGRSEIAAVRRAEALTLRKSGLTYQAIGEKLGVSNHSAWLYVKRGLQEIAKLAEPDAIALRTLQMERLNRLLNSIWDRAITGGDLAAYDRVLKTIKQMNDLTGINAPAELKVTGDWRVMAEREGFNADELRRQLVSFFAGQLAERGMGSEGHRRGQGGSATALPASEDVPALGDGTTVEGFFVEDVRGDDPGQASVPDAFDAVEGLL